MNDQDIAGFTDLMVGLCDVYGKEPPRGMAMDIYFSALRDYPLEQVRIAANKHVQDPKAGQFFPKPADFIRHLSGSELTTDQIISAARLKKTPLGILCRIHIGHFDLEHNTDMFYLKQRAEECLQMLPEWKARAKVGDYTDHEVSIMLKHKVNPLKPLFDGLPPPANREGLKARALEIMESDRYKFLIADTSATAEDEEPLKAAPNVAAFIGKISEQLS